MLVDGINLPTIEDQWKSYFSMVVLSSAARIGEISQRQLYETRMAFYAGATATLGLVLDVGQTKVSEDGGAAYLETLIQECREFQRKVATEALAAFTEPLSGG